MGYSSCPEKENGTKKCVFAIVSFSEKNETVNAASANVMSVFITLPAPDDPANSNSCGYALQHYYRCIHNTRDWSPSKDPRRKLKLNPSARVKNTNCPFQMVVKIKQESC